MCTKKTVLNSSYQDFLCSNINNHLICYERTINTYLKAKKFYTQHEFLALNTYLLSFKKIRCYNIHFFVIKYYIIQAAQESAPEKRQLVAASGSDEYSCEFGSNKYFALCAFGGVLSCGITHTAVTPLDLVKCRLQVLEQLFKTENKSR